jgi:hypothetical protein
MSHHNHNEKSEQNVRRDLEAPDPAGNPSEHTRPRSNPDADPSRLENAKEDRERTIAK